MLPYASAPKEILYSKEMSSDEKILYISMLDLYKLSFINGDAWKDEYGIFIYYSIPSIEKAIGCSRPTAIKILNSLEKNGYITKKHQAGKPTKIYLTENEYTQCVWESMKNCKNNKKHKKIAPRKIAKQEEVVAEVATTESEVKTVHIVDYTGNQSIFDVFKAIIGREPDDSFKKCMAKRAAQMNLNAENMRTTIELARKARNPEAYILAITKPNTEYQPTQAPEPVDKPLEEWEVEWYLEIMQHHKEMGEPYSQEKIDEYQKILKEFSQKRIEKQITDMFDNY